MDIHWTYGDCSVEEVNQIERHWQRIQQGLAAKISELANAPSELRIVVEHVDAEPEWSVQAALHLPGATLVADHQTRTPEMGLDRAVHEFANAIERLGEVEVTSTLRREGLDGVETLLESCRTRGGRSDAFLSFLAPMATSLAPYVGHELMIRENDGSLVSDELTVADVIDQVMVDAWDTFPSRNRSLGLDLWLVQLADRAISRWCQATPSQSLEDELPMTDAQSNDSFAEQWAELNSSYDATELREVLPGKAGFNGWDDLELDVKQTHLAQLLAKLTHEQRQAFVLNALHGYTSAEIADFQNRVVRDVESDIAAAAVHIERMFHGERERDPEEVFERRELREYRRRGGKGS